MTDCVLRLTAWVDLHPTRENRRARQTSSNRSIGNHEHLRLLGIFGEVSLLDSHSDEDDAAEEDREADDDAVAIGLGEELDSHLSPTYRILPAEETGRQSRKSPPSEAATYTFYNNCQTTIIFCPNEGYITHGVQAGFDDTIGTIGEEDPPHHAREGTLERQTRAVLQLSL